MLRFGTSARSTFHPDVLGTSYGDVRLPTLRQNRTYCNGKLRERRVGPPEQSTTPPKISGLVTKQIRNFAEASVLAMRITSQVWGLRSRPALEPGCK
jgi:hypothetical protein